MKLLSLKTTATGALIKTDYIYDVVDVQKLLSESKHTIRGIISSGAGGVGKSVITDLLGRLLAEALPSDEKTLILDFDTSHGSGIHDLVEPIYTTRSQMRTTKDWVDAIWAGEKPTPLWDPKNPRGSIVQPIKYSGSNQKESNLLYLPMSPENRDEYLYDYEPPKKPAKPEKEEIKDKAVYAETLKNYKKDLEVYEKKLKIHTEFHKQLRQLRNQFDDYRIRFMLFDLAPGSNQSINAFFKTADFIFLVLDAIREGENQYKNYLAHMMKSISYLEYDTKTIANGEFRPFHLPVEYNDLLTQNCIFSHQVSFTSRQI